MPGQSLNGLNLEYRQVVQEQNEMIIIFPYAYHQVYNTGANISEEMPYSNERSANFPQKDLCHQCGPTCSDNGLHVQLNSIQEGQASILRGRSLAKEGAMSLDQRTMQPENSGRATKRKIEESDTPSMFMPPETPAKKKRTLMCGLSRRSGEDIEIKEEVDQKFAHGHGKNPASPGEFA